MSGIQKIADMIKEWEPSNKKIDITEIQVALQTFLGMVQGKVPSKYK